MKELPTAEAILKDLIAIENFTDEQTCRDLIDIHNRFGTLTSSSDNGFYLPETRHRDPASFQRAKSIIHRIIGMIDSLYHEKVGCDLALICALTGHFRHITHADNAMVVCPRHGNNAEKLVELGCQCDDIEVRPNHTSWRKYTALLYLDSDHDGGNIVFGEGPNVFGKIYCKEIVVKRGLLVLSPSNELYYHRTTPVTKGVRYSMNMWFTTDTKYISGDWK